MSIVVKFSGQTESLQLPDIPVAYPDGFPADDWPDLSTLKYHTVFLSTLGGYHLAATEYPLGCISMGDDGDWLAQATSDDFIGISETANCVVLTCDDGDTAWVPRAAAGMTHDRPVNYEIINPNANPVLGATMLAWYAFGTTDGYLYLLWSDYDIKKTSDLDADTGAINSWETEPYHKSDVSKPPFILPDGTELPALPDGCFDRTPYGFILKIDVRDSVGTVAYYLFLSANSISFCPGELIDAGYNLVLSVSDTCASYGFSEKTADWVDGQGGVNGMWTVDQGGVPMSYIGDMGTAGLYEVLWSNCDILTVTGVDEEAGMPIIGTEIWRKSDVNYRITEGWMRSIADEARRLGGKTGGMLPEVMLDIYKSVAASATEVEA